MKTVLISFELIELVRISGLSVHPLETQCITFLWRNSVSRRGEMRAIAYHAYKSLPIIRLQLRLIKTLITK